MIIAFITFIRYISFEIGLQKRTGQNQTERHDFVRVVSQAKIKSQERWRERVERKIIEREVVEREVIERKII